MTWTQSAPANVPAARTDSQLAYDPARGRVVMFGGTSPVRHLGDCWEYDGNNWVVRWGATRPSQRYGHAMAYDPTMGEVLLFGGGGSPGTSETWSWDGSSWTLRGKTRLPDGRLLHAMEYDAQRQNVVLFGGTDFSVTMDDTWLWDGFAWTEASPADKPSARAGHAMAYDRARGVVVLFGGGTNPLLVTGYLDDTWEWDGLTWRQRFPSVRPPSRERHAMAYDSARGRVVLFGGYGSSQSKLQDTWEWDGTDWIERAPPIGPAARVEHTMAYDEARGVVVLHGGYDEASIIRGDTWEWDGTYWWWRTFNNNVPMLARSAAVYDRARQRVVAFGGRRNQPIWGSNDVWEWDGQDWLRRSPLNPSPWYRNFHGLAYDEARRQMVTFAGGGPNYPGLQETWLYAPIDPAHYTPYGQGCSGSAGTPSLSPLGGALPWIGGAFEFELSNLVAGQPAWAFVGVSNQQWGAIPLPFELSLLGLTGCRIFASGEIVLPLVNTAGLAQGSLEIPVVPAIVGTTVYLQGLAADPVRGLTVSDAGAVEFGSR